MKEQTHELKTWTEYFNLMLSGEKTFELRKNDRDFKVGDRLDLMEWNPDTKEYTGRHIHRFITHILSDNPFIDLKGNVILSVSPISEETDDIEDEDLLEIARRWIDENTSPCGDHTLGLITPTALGAFIGGYKMALSTPPKIDEGEILDVVFTYCDTIMSQTRQKDLTKAIVKTLTEGISNESKL